VVRYCIFTSLTCQQKNPWPIIGGVATSICSVKDFIM
jgi:hypothetical protein